MKSLIFYFLVLVMINASAGVIDTDILKKIPPVALEPEPTRVFSVATLPATITSSPDGTAKVKIGASRHGTSECTVTLEILKIISEYEGLFLGDIFIHFDKSDGKEKLVDYEFPTPGVFRISRIGGSLDPGLPDYIADDECEWLETTWDNYTLKVTPHEQYPCSVYPGMEKTTAGATWACFPAGGTSAQIKNFSFLCEPGTVYQNLSGYLFGCVPLDWKQ